MRQPTGRGPSPTTFRFTKTALLEAIAAVVATGKRQVELCDTELPNFRLLVYGASGKATYTFGRQQLFDAFTARSAAESRATDGSNHPHEAANT